MIDKLADATEKLLSIFASGEFPEAAARTFISRKAGDNKPCLHWSLGNQLLMLISGTEDARGFKQWHEVKRNVKPGSKAIYILAPRIRKVTATILDQSGQKYKEERSLLTGFRAVPVFRFEDTDGEPLPSANYNPPQFPPLYDVAQHYGMVKYAASEGPALGSCSTNGTITLHSYDVDVFFHELAHQVHNTIKPLKPGQHSDQEIIAEMCACILCEIYGYEGYLWQGWEYIKAYGGQDKQKTLTKLMQLLAEVNAVLTKILVIC
jgi:hypothetical protein